MSLKFGIYLVEQRIISPEQFCGLVKIQQEACMSLPTLAIRKNVLTIKQVTRVLDLQEKNPLHTFVQIAMAEDLIDSSDADQLLHHQQLSCPMIQRLLVECGLLTQHQSVVLKQHFERQLAIKSRNAEIQNAPATTAPVVTTPEVTLPGEEAVGPRKPKFSQRPATAQSGTTPVGL